MEEFIVITFHSTNFAMQTESYLKSNGIKQQIIPTPREITLSCGLSIRTPIENKDGILDLIKENKITIKKVYKLSGSGKDRIIEEIGV
jgi:hypothetical protein